MLPSDAAPTEPEYLDPADVHDADDTPPGWYWAGDGWAPSTVQP